MAPQLVLPALENRFESSKNGRRVLPALENRFIESSKHGRRVEWRLEIPGSIEASKRRIIEAADHRIIEPSNHGSRAISHRTVPYYVRMYALSRRAVQNFLQCGRFNALLRAGWGEGDY